MTQPKIDHYEAVRSTSIQTVTIDGIAYNQFTVQPGDVQDWDAAEGNAGGNGKPNERAEVSLAAMPSADKAKSPYNVKDGMLQTYDVDYLIGNGFPYHDASRHEWAVITQFHPQDDNPSGFKGFTGVSVHNGMITLERPDAPGVYFAQEPARTALRLQRRLVVKWSSKSDGYVKWIDRATAKILGRFDGATTAPGEFHYIKWGYYRAGGLPPGTICISTMDINDGDIAAKNPRNSTPLDPAKPSVNPNTGASTLISVRNELVQLDDPGVRPQIDAITAELNKGPWTP